jgi:hypothetical protein
MNGTYMLARGGDFSKVNKMILMEREGEEKAGRKEGRYERADWERGSIDNSPGSFVGGAL